MEFSAFLIIDHAGLSPSQIDRQAGKRFYRYGISQTQQPGRKPLRATFVRLATFSRITIVAISEIRYLPEVILTKCTLLVCSLRFPSRNRPSPQVIQDSVSLTRQTPELPSVAWFSGMRIRSVDRMI